MIDILLLLQIGATWALVGLIWFVQIVHYPLFDTIGQSSFASYERRHQQRTTWVVAPLMLTEAATATLLVWTPLPDTSRGLAALGLGLVVLIWLSTLLLQMPCHGRLASQFSANVHRKLVATNWLRTIAWSVRGVVVACIGWQGWVESLH